MELHDDEFARTSAVLPKWSELRHLGITTKYAKGAAIFREEDQVHSLYLILKGEVRMEQLHLDGTEKTYWYLGEGCVLGETPLFHGLPSRLTAICRVSSELCAFPRDLLMQEIFPKHPDLAADMLRNMARKIRVLTNQISTLSMDDLAVRICKYLQLHMCRDGAGDLCSIPNINQQDLANLMGVHRVTCNRVLRRLERDGIIAEFNKKAVRILDEEAFNLRVKGFAERDSAEQG